MGITCKYEGCQSPKPKTVHPNPVNLEQESGIWRFPKVRGTFLGVPIRRTTVYWGLYWGTLILGNYHILHGHRASDRIAEGSTDLGLGNSFVCFRGLTPPK